MTEVQILDIMYEAFQLAMKLSLPGRARACALTGVMTDCWR